MTFQGFQMDVQIHKTQSCFLRENRSHHEPNPAQGLGIIRDFLWSFSSVSFIFLFICDILPKRDLYFITAFLIPYLRHWI